MTLLPTDEVAAVGTAFHAAVKHTIRTLAMGTCTICRTAQRPQQTTYMTQLIIHTGQKTLRFVAERTSCIFMTTASTQPLLSLAIPHTELVSLRATLLALHRVAQ